LSRADYILRPKRIPPPGEVKVIDYPHRFVRPVRGNPDTGDQILIVE
jgi:hypothetical protein